MRAWLERVWFSKGLGGFVLWPLAVLFAVIVAIRRVAYRRGWFTAISPACPVVVVGNLTVGGSGKTPFVVWLATALAGRGLRVGIVSRGYGGAARVPTEVTRDSDPRLVGDEPVLLARRTSARVVVARDRIGAARLLATEVDLIIADDGLQHYRLARELEIAIIDGRRRFGNGRLLPAGPLREPLARLASVDFLVVNGAGASAGEIPMELVPGAVVRLDDGMRTPLADYAGREVHAVAGIGDPARFFATLRAAGLRPIEHPLADHAPAEAYRLSFGDGLPVLMTEKDAVKCAGAKLPSLAYVEVSARLPDADAETLLARVLELVSRP
jgi:tetraacyldisaccharide 4'-kinase